MSISERMQSFMFEIETPEGETKVFEGEMEEEAPKDPSEMTAQERENRRAELLSKIQVGKMANKLVSEIGEPDEEEI